MLQFVGIMVLLTISLAFLNKDISEKKITWRDLEDKTDEE